MGLNTVAVIYNDHLHEIEKSGPLGRRISEAVCRRDRDGLRGWFGCGQIISTAHADYEQVVIVGKNTGVTAHDAKDLSYFALDTMAECLKRHGWIARPPARKRKAKESPK